MEKTFDYYSLALTNNIAKPPVMNQPNADDGKVRIKYFSFTAAAEIPINSVTGLVKIPAAARIIGGAYQHSAHGTGVLLDFGIYGADGSGYYTGTTADDIDFFIDGDDTSSAGQDSIAELVNGDLNAEYLTTKEVFIAVKNLIAVLPAAATLTGHIKYVVN